MGKLAWLKTLVNYLGSRHNRGMMFLCLHVNHRHALSFVTLRLVVLVGKRNARTRTNRRFDRPKSSLIQCAHQRPERLKLLVIRRQQHKRTSTTTRPGQLASEPSPLGNGENALQRRMTHAERAQQIVVNAHERPQSLVHRVGGFVRFEQCDRFIHQPAHSLQNGPDRTGEQFQSFRRTGHEVGRATTNTRINDQHVHGTAQCDDLVHAGSAPKPYEPPVGRDLIINAGRFHVHYDLGVERPLVNLFEHIFAQLRGQQGDRCFAL
uniref:Uncharacterized protein n=1 Tax=Anopheles merus TaxID=30066 RepID=A0A182V4L8_ANOME